MSPNETTLYDGRVRELGDIMAVIASEVARDGGTARLGRVDYETGRVEVVLAGACGSCSLTGSTLEAGIGRILTDRLDWVKEVVGLVDEDREVVGKNGWRPRGATGTQDGSRVQSVREPYGLEAAQPPLSAGVVDELLLEAPSGLAGNLFVTAFMLAGFPRKEIDALPTLLGLVGFDVVWDDWGVCDGVGGLFDGGFAAILGQVSSRVDALVASKASTALELALGRAELPEHLVRDHVACDTMFDAVAFFMALQSMNWPQVSVVGPLPQTPVDEDVVSGLLKGWRRTPVPLDSALITPTAASLLATSGARQLTEVPADARLLGEVRGPLARRYGLGPLRCWVRGR